MRVIYINPDKQLVEEREVPHPIVALSEDKGSWIDGHWIVRHFFPEHDAVLDENGLTNRKKVWRLGDVHIWGPMVIYGVHEGAVHGAKIELFEVRRLVQFNKPRYL